MAPTGVIYGCVAISLGAVVLGLMSGWARYAPTGQVTLANTKYDYTGIAPHRRLETLASGGGTYIKDGTDDAGQWLGRPSWRNNALAWHPIFMVCGFFMSQVFSNVAIAFFGDHSKAKTFVGWLFFQASAICFACAGVRAMIIYKYRVHEPNLITLHSWTGVAAIAIFAVSSTYSLGLGLAGLCTKISDTVGAKVTTVQVVLSLLALGFTTIAALSGLTVWHGEFGCQNFAINASFNPASIYYRFPWACRLSNGAGLAIIGTVIFTVVSLIFTKSVAIYHVEPTDIGIEGAKNIVAGGDEN